MPELQQQFPQSIEKGRIATVQINLGNRCNLSCHHCHHNASPAGDKNMDSETADRVARHIVRSSVANVEFTGGSPEMNPNLEMFIKLLADSGKRISVRTSLTILTSKEYAGFISLYRDNGVNLFASLPCYLEENTDRQRGSGAYAKSVEALKILNAAGFGTGGAELSLVYNPGGAFLPPDQGELEQTYRENLGERHGISFTRLLAIANAPIGRFRDEMIRSGRFDVYCQLLKDRFNPDTVSSLMCRGIISVDYAGFVYDCDFNQATGIRCSGVDGKRFWEIDLASYSGEVTFMDHCFCCTAGQGSSCGGALA